MMLVFLSFFLAIKWDVKTKNKIIWKFRHRIHMLLNLDIKDIYHIHLSEWCTPNVYCKMQIASLFFIKLAKKMIYKKFIWKSSNRIHMLLNLGIKVLAHKFACQCFIKRKVSVSNEYKVQNTPIRSKYSNIMRDNTVSKEMYDKKVNDFFRIEKILRLINE